MKKTVRVSIFALLLSLISFPSLSVGDEQAKESNDVALEIMTIEVMVDQLEKMPRATKDEANAWAQLSLDIMGRFSKIVTYETSDNLNLWVVMGRWAAAKGVGNKSPYANKPFIHIQRLRPDYQKDDKLIRLMAKLNSIRNKEHQDFVMNKYRHFVLLFEECDTNDATFQLLIGRAYNEGYGLCRNVTEAVKWYKRAAAAGNADAIGELGDVYLHGRGGLERNEEVGVKLLNEAVEKGSALAAYALGRYYQPDKYSAKLWKRKGDRKKAIQMFRIAAKRGYYKAFYLLAEEYVKAGNGTEALRWANGGDEPDPNNKMEHRLWERNRSMADNWGFCSYIKGEVYALGIGEVEQDLGRAKELFEKSCLKGSNIMAAEALAAMYTEGIGVEANAALTKQWKTKAKKLFGPGFTDGYFDRYINGDIRDFAKRLREASKRTLSKNNKQIGNR